MTLDLLFIIIGFIGLIFASISDWKTREVPDWLNYGLIIIGFGLRIIYSLNFSEWSVLFNGLIGFGSMFALGNLMYYTRQWGGGDAKLIMAMGVLFPYNLNFLLGLVMNIFLFGAIYGICWAVFLAIKNRAALSQEFKKLLEKDRNLRHVSYIIISLLIVIMPSIQERILMIILFAAAIILFINSYLITLVHSIEKVSMYKLVSSNRLTEGDWLARDVYVGAKLLLKKKSLGLEKEDILLLKKNKISKVLIKEGIPFVPSFLIGFIVSLSIGNVLLLFL